MKPIPFEEEEYTDQEEHNNAIACPSCRKGIVRQVDGRYGIFYGCSNFRGGCKFTVKKESYSTFITSLEESKNLSQFKPNSYQEAILDFMPQASNFGVISAAGSGKTRLITQGIYNLHEQGADTTKMAYTVFGRDNQKEAYNKLMFSGCNVVTTHVLGKQSLEKHYGKRFNQYNGGLDEDKVRSIIYQELAKIGQDFGGWFPYAVNQVINTIKTALKEPKEGLINEIVNTHNVMIPQNFKTMDGRINLAEFYTTIKKVFKLSLQDTNTIDFVDMIAMPFYNQVPLIQYNIMWGDEFQDWSGAQAWLFSNSLVPGGQMGVVGDPNQAIYTWRGAGQDIMNRVIDENGLTTFNMPLTYRVPQAGVAYINQLLPWIPFEAREEAIEGEVHEDCDPFELFSNAEGGQVFLARTNSVLTKAYFELLARGKRAVLLGRALSPGFESMCKRLSSKLNFNTHQGLVEFKTLVNTYYDKEVSILTVNGYTKSLVVLKDDMTTLETILSHSRDLSQLWDTLRAMSTNDPQAYHVILATIHKFKGKEADDIILLNRSGIPHELSQTREQLEEENRVLYVALSRFKRRLFINNIFA